MADIGHIDHSATSKNVACRLDSLRSKSLVSNRDSWSALSPEGGIKSFNNHLGTDCHTVGEENLQSCYSDPEASALDAGPEQGRLMLIREHSYNRLLQAAHNWQVQAEMWQEQSKSEMRVVQQQEQQLQEKDELIAAAKNKFKEIQYYRIQTLRAQDNSRNARAQVAQLESAIKQLEKQLKKAQQGTRMAISHIRSLEKEREERAMHADGSEPESPKSPQSPKSPKSPRSPRFTI